MPVHCTVFVFNPEKEACTRKKENKFGTV